jgi:hypothetical protein
MLLEKAPPSKKVAMSQNVDAAERRYTEAKEMADYLADRIGTFHLHIH